MNEVVLKNYDLSIGNINYFSDEFINYLDVDKSTLNTYRVGILSFVNYLKDNSINIPTRDDVISYRNMLRDNYPSNTVNTYMTGVKSMFKFLSLKGKCDDLSKDVKGAKYSNTPKKEVLSLEQSQNIYKCLTDKREKALFSLLVTTGCRGVEISNAKIEDIKIHNGEYVLWIKCKKHSEKDEYVKLSQQVMKDLKDYIGSRTNGYIFISTSRQNYGEGITTKSIRNIIKGIFKKFELNKDTLSLHSTRRTAATLMYEAGQSVYDIQQVLHHANPSTTFRYINAVTRDNNNSENIVSNLLLGGE